MPKTTRKKQINVRIDRDLLKEFKELSPYSNSNITKIVTLAVQHHNLTVISQINKMSLTELQILHDLYKL